jgi:ribosomal protein S18 acetylase RimI-like enzyme
MTNTAWDGQFDILAYKDRHYEGVATLWREAFAQRERWQMPEFAIPAKLANQPELFLVAVHGERVIGTAMAGYDGHRGWLYAVAVLRVFRGRGVGSALLREAERRLLAKGCAKINLQIVPANGAVSAFYEQLGYAVEERICMGKRIGAAAKETRI